METFFQILNEPVVLWSLLAGSIGLVLIDYYFPVDWPAYFGYVLFAMFIGATIAAPPSWSLVAIVVVFLTMLILHVWIFSRYLTNAPRIERPDAEKEAIVNERSRIETKSD